MVPAAPRKRAHGVSEECGRRIQDKLAELGKRLRGETQAEEEEESYDSDATEDEEVPAWMEEEARKIDTRANALMRAEQAAREARAKFDRADAENWRDALFDAAEIEWQDAADKLAAAHALDVGCKQSWSLDDYLSTMRMRVDSSVKWRWLRLWVAWIKQLKISTVLQPNTKLCDGLTHTVKQGELLCLLISAHAPRTRTPKFLKKMGELDEAFRVFCGEPDTLFAPGGGLCTKKLIQLFKRSEDSLEQQHLKRIIKASKMVDKAWDDLLQAFQGKTLSDVLGAA